MKYLFKKYKYLFFEKNNSGFAIPQILIIGIGINTNYYPKMNNFSSTSIKKIINKSIDNNKLLNIIRDNYEKFLFKSKKNGFSELKKLVNNL